MTQATTVPDAGPPPGEVMLGPATRLLWRSHDTVHLELGGRGVVVSHLPRAVIEGLAASPAGRRGPRPAPSGRPHLDAVARDALAELTAEGYLWRRPTTVDDPRLRPPRPRLAGELAALAGRRGEGGAAVLAARARSAVSVDGHARLAAQVAVLLATAGVGRVWCTTRGSARLAHTGTAAIAPRDEGFELAEVVRAAIERAAPEVDTTPMPVDERPDLTVLVLDGPHDEDRRRLLHADGAAHLCLSSGPDGGVVGPLVLPGLTSCLRCAELHRRDRDDAWPALAAQLRVPRQHAASCDVASAAVLSGTVTAQALAFLDGDEVAAIDGTIELRPPDWRLRRRSWPPHPACGCGGWAE